MSTCRRHTRQKKGIGCLYMPHFAAWAVQRAHQVQEDVIIHSRGQVFAGSPLFLDRGLKVGDTLHRARILFPQAHFLLRDIPAEQIGRDEILDRLYQVTPQVRPLTDRELAGCWVLLQGFPRPAFIAVLEEFLACGGYALQPSHAMLAALYSRAGEMVALPPADVSAFFAQAPIHLLRELGISEKTLEFLHLVGLKTLASLHPLTARHLKARFGAEGARLYRLLHPVADASPVPYYDTRSVTVSQHLEWPVTQLEQVETLLGELVIRALALVPDRSPTWLKLTIRCRGGRVVEQARALKRPSGDERLLKGLAMLLFTEHVQPSPDVETISLLLGGLAPSQAVQTSLFRSRSDLTTSLQGILHRFPQKLFWPVHNTDAPFLPEEEFSFGAVAG